MRLPVMRALTAAAGGAILAMTFSPSARVLATTPGQETFDRMFCIQRTPDSACYNGGAQTIVAELAGTLSWVELPMSRADFTTHDLVVEIHATTPDGALLQTSEPVPASLIPIGTRDGTPDTWAWIHFTFPSPISVSVGDALAIVVPTVPVSDSYDPAWGWGKADHDLYANGVAYGGIGPTWFPPDGRWDAWWDGSDMAFRTPISSVDALPAPELTVGIDPTGGSDPKAGSVSIHGTLVCAAGPVSATLEVTVSQGVGKRAVVEGAAETWAYCDGTGTWSATVTPDSGLLRPGQVSVQVHASFSDDYGQTGETDAHQAVRIRR